MIELLFLIKLLVSVLVVVSLSLIAEHVSPRIAGIISGLPTGTAIMLFFFGLEINLQFASKSALYNMIGVSAELFFVYLYYKASSFFKKFNIVLSSLTAIIGFLAIASILRLIKPNNLIAIFIPAVSIILFVYLFKKIKDVKIEKKIKVNHKVLLIRALFAASIILIITGIANAIGPEWAGLFSSFPTTVFPFILIIHFTYDVKHVHTIIKNLPIGLGSIIAYSLTISITYPLIGIYWGTAISFLAAAIYIMVYMVIKRLFKH